VVVFSFIPDKYHTVIPDTTLLEHAILIVPMGMSWEVRAWLDNKAPLHNEPHAGAWAGLPKPRACWKGWGADSPSYSLGRFDISSHSGLKTKMEGLENTYLCRECLPVMSMSFPLGDGAGGGVVLDGAV
jgi:hypothetical protein